MPFTVPQFAKVRPYLFHLTHRNNVENIRRSRVLHSAASLLRQAGDGSFPGRKRAESVTVQIGSVTINIRDQQPLHAGNISLQSDWSFEDVVRSLNERVFFWPGRDTGPIGYGERHFDRYADERPTMIRVATVDLFNANSNKDLLFCRFNSGSPRCSNGVGSPRGPNTFVTCAYADFTPSKVVEVTIMKKTILPTGIDIAGSIYGPWRPL